MNSVSRSKSTAVLALCLLVLGVSGLSAALGLFAAATAEPPDERRLAAVWAVLMLVAVGAALPSLRLFIRGPALPAAPVAQDERRRQCLRAELGAIAWLLLATAWIVGFPLAAWSVLAGAACIPPTVVLFRAWARLRT